MKRSSKRCLRDSTFNSVLVRVTVLLSLAALCGALASCRPAIERTPDSSAPVRLTALVWAPDWPHEMHRIAEEFHRTHPDITVDIQFMIGNSVEENLKPRIATHNLPDLVSLNPNAYSAELADQGILADLGDTLAWNNMLDVLKSDWTSPDARRYGISGGVAASLIYYNKAMFRQAGITHLPTSFDEFLAVCATLKKAGFTPLILTGAFPNTLANGPFSVGFANNVIARHPLDWKLRIADGSLNLKTADAADIFAKIKLLADRGYVQAGFMNTGYDEGIRLFAEGKAAMAFQGSWSSGALLRSRHADAGVFMPPWNAAGTPIVPVLGSETGFAVCNTRNKAAALQFLDFIYGEGFVIQQSKRRNLSPLKYVPSRIPADPDIARYLRDVKDAPLVAGPYYVYLPTATIELLHPLLQDVLFGKITPDDAALILDASIRQEAMTESK